MTMIFSLCPCILHPVYNTEIVPTPVWRIFNPLNWALPYLSHCWMAVKEQDSYEREHPSVAPPTCLESYSKIIMAESQQAWCRSNCELHILICRL